MIDEIISLAVGNGIWAALFCFLFMYMLKDTRNREERYNVTIEALSSQLDKTTSALRICEDIKGNSELSVLTGNEIKLNTEHIKEDVEALRATMERL